MTAKNWLEQAFIDPSAVSGGRGKYLDIPNTAALHYRFNYANKPSNNIIPNLGTLGAANNATIANNGAGLSFGRPGPYGYAMSNASPNVNLFAALPSGSGVSAPYTSPAGMRRFTVVVSLRLDAGRGGSGYRYPCTHASFGLQISQGSGNPCWDVYRQASGGSYQTMDSSSGLIPDGVDLVAAGAYDADAGANMQLQIYQNGVLICSGSDVYGDACNVVAGSFTLGSPTSQNGFSLHWCEVHPGTVTPGGLSVADYTAMQYTAMRGWL